MARRFLLGCCLALAGLSTVGSTWAQDTLLDELYGRGVHAYYAHDYQDAFMALSEAVASGSKDPRVYYFRALSESKLGRPDEATDDFKKGAELEVSSSGVYSVGRSLERVQGPDRLELEKHRRYARLTVRNQAEAIAKKRYEQRKADETAVLRGAPAAANPAATKPAAVKPAPAAAGADGTDPFSEEFLVQTL